MGMARALHRLSGAWARVEIFLAAVLAAVVTGLILLNVVTRSMRMAIYWVDEAAIYAMIAMAFLAASAAIERREAIAVTLVLDAVPERLVRLLWLAVDGVTLAFAGLLLWFCWIWFDPLALWQAGFDFRAFQRATFNFIYAEPTSTLGFRKYWVWLILPVFASGFALHALSNLVRSLRGELPGGAGAETQS